MPKTYDANCHCGIIRYTVTLPEALSPEGPGKINQCNCSICSKNGYLLVYPKREDVVFLDGSEARLKSYSFGQKRTPNRFCPECGSSVLIDLANSEFERYRPVLAMNVGEHFLLFLSGSCVGSHSRHHRRVALVVVDPRRSSHQADLPADSSLQRC
nr:hypothetical protein CFP56_69500 [Quercus suber]